MASHRSKSKQKPPDMERHIERDIERERDGDKALEIYISEPQRLRPSKPFENFIFTARDNAGILRTRRRVFTFRTRTNMDA